MIPIFEPELSGHEKQYLVEAVKTGWISSQGEYVKKFEKNFSKRFGKRFGVTTSSCTTALHLSLAALGIRSGDEVICPDLTFIAPANMIALTGAKPVLVDVEEDTWNMDPELVRDVVNEKTKAIIVVHSFGHSARIDELQEISEQHGVPIIEDNAESPGATYKGKILGGLGKLSCFSFYANKILTTGEGGMVLTDDEKLYHRLLELRDHGMSLERRYVHVALGFNYRMTNMQAAIGLAQLERLDETLGLRRQQELLYVDLLSQSDSLTLRPKQTWSQSVHWLMTIRLRKEGIRDHMLEYLKQLGIDCRQMIYPVHEARHFSQNYRGENFPVSVGISHNSLHLPSSTNLSRENIEMIAETVLRGLELYG